MFFGKWTLNLGKILERDTFKMAAQNFDTQKRFFLFIEKVTVYSSISESLSSAA